MWFSEQVRPGIWVGFTDTTAGNLAFHVGDDAQDVAGRRADVETRLARQSLSAAAPSPVLAYMNQVHGADVAVIAADGTAATGASAPTVDAMVMCPDGEPTGLAVMVADCVPVVLVGETSSGSTVIGVAHAGRPGVEKDVIGAVVAQMHRSGAVSLEAWLGPSVCGKCYEVPEAMRTAVAAVAPASHSITTWGTPALDLPAAVVEQLTSNGVTAHASGICTLEDSRYFSHRRSQRDGEAEGRFIGFVAAMPGSNLTGTNNVQTNESNLTQ
ncbi:polyphenol oxidase family protein [Arthrobacter sp. TWP1-1]|uniref:polyphenol oxidase family protein n=1 Tax=Arthrobacter sp. TWP1-1 TaxID=2804568 RepID=UPI003CED1AD2